MHTRYQDPSPRLSAGFIPQLMVYEEIPFEPSHWEYRLITINTSEEALPDEAMFNTLGQEGWLLNSVLPLENGKHTTVQYYFIRQLPQTRGAKK